MADAVSAAPGTGNTPAYYRSSVGDLSVVALHEGTVTRERAAGFVRNAAEDKVEAAFSGIGLAPGTLTLTFTPLAVELPGELVLIDTGYGDNGPSTTGRLRENLRAAGYVPQDVGTVLISHFHTDHISGLLTKAGEPAFPRARILVPQAEWDYWMNEDNFANAPDRLKPNFELCRKVFDALSGGTGTFQWGDEVKPGVTALPAAGHTPGQTMFRISDRGESLLFVADVTNNPFVFARHPGWQPGFDIMPEEAVRCRRAVLAEAASQGARLFFFHAPFPGLGVVRPEQDGYAFVPQIWGT